MPISASAWGWVAATRVTYLLIGIAVAYLTLWGLTIYLYLLLRESWSDNRELRAQNARYADALARQYPAPPTGPGLIRPADPDQLQPVSSYFTRKIGR